MNPVDLQLDASAQDSRDRLLRAGWREIGVGDWSWVLADESGAWAARITPFDPAYRLHAQACLDGPPNPWLPRVAAILPLRRDGYVTVMERLWPADEAAAVTFCAALGTGNDSGYAAAAPSSNGPPDESRITELRARIFALIAEGTSRFRLWGGSDIRPGNVMRDAEGQLKLIDPVFLKGRALVEAIAEGRRDLLTDFSFDQLADFLSIPVFEIGEETDELRRRLTALYR